jgi:hypothetical protein
VTAHPDARKSPILISRLNGGLGNQLFQYACGRSISLASGVQLVLDASGLQSINHRVTRRDFELDVYGIKARTTTIEEGAKCRRAARWGKIGAWIAGLELVTEAPDVYPNLRHPIECDTVLEGFWQSENCFASHSEDIRADLTPQRELSEQSRRIAQFLEAAPSVAIHVRRGDYVSLQSAARFHGTLPLTYYMEAAQRIRAHDRDAHWVVFSDDIEWCRSTLSFLDAPPLFVDHNQDRDAWQDLHLMSLCRHHIIANSSFSWWGAWLSERHDRKDQMIYAPAKWFVESDPYEEFRIPKRWTRL